MNDFVTAMHTESGLIEEIPNGVSLAEAEYEVLEYILKFVPERPHRAARRQHHRHRPGVPGQVHAAGRHPPALPQRRRVVSIKELSRRWYPARLLPGSRRRTAGTAPSPTSWNPSANSSTTARRCSSPPRARPATRRARRPRRRWPRGPPACPRIVELPRRRMVGVAQLVERWLVVPDVAGSSPVIHPRCKWSAWAGAATRCPTRCSSPVSTEILRWSSSAAQSATRIETRPDLDLESETISPWILIVWNDPINLMNYVVHVFRSYFGFPPRRPSG